MEVTFEHAQGSVNEKAITESLLVSFHVTSSPMQMSPCLSDVSAIQVMQWMLKVEKMIPVFFVEYLAECLIETKLIEI